MALSDIWRIVVTADTLRPIWAERRFDSPLATAGGGQRFGVQPESTVTLRTRYRTDIDTTSALEGPDGRLWFAHETLEVGRRKWLDIGLSTYPGIVTVPDDSGTSTDFDPPAGWGLMAGGNPVSSLDVATATYGRGRFWSGTFSAVAGAAGTIGSALQGSLFYGSSHYAMAGRLTRTRNIVTFVFTDASDYTMFGSLRVYPATGYGAIGTNGLGLGLPLTSAEYFLSAGEQIDLAAQDEWTATLTVESQ